MATQNTVYKEQQTSYNVVNTVGVSGTPSVAGTTVTVTSTGGSGYNVDRCFGATVPADGETGFVPGCYFHVSTGVSGGTAYFNEGSSTSCAFRPVSTGGVTVHPTKSAINSTNTATAAQVATGYITSTSAAATTITLPTGTLLGAALSATQGTTLELYVDNTAGANTVTMAVAVNGIKSDAANTTAASFGQLTVASGVTGLARFTIMFSSPTAYVFTRTA